MPDLFWPAIMSIGYLLTGGFSLIMLSIAVFIIVVVASALSGARDEPRYSLYRCNRREELQSKLDYLALCVSLDVPYSEEGYQWFLADQKKVR